MPDEDLINLEHTVLAHEAELDRQSKEIAALMDDLKVVLQCNPGLIDQIRLRARHNIPSDSDEFVQRCRKFVNRYAIPLTP
jgi:hypothetical protein